MVDKHKQHEEDIAATKRRLEEARERKLAVIQRAEKEKKLQRSLSKEGYSVVATDESRERRKSLSKTPTSNKKREQPEKKSSQQQPPAASAKKKLTMDDLDNDEDDVSDWSDLETPNKRKKRALIESDDDEANERVIRDKRQTRKLAVKADADAILNSDPATQHLRHFDEEDVRVAEDAGVGLGDYLDRDDDAISVSSVGSLDDDDSPNDHIYLDDVADAAGVVASLSARFDPPPKLVPPMPEWLNALLDDWEFKRHEVALFGRVVDPRFLKSSQAKRQIVSEKTFAERVRKRKAQVAREGHWFVSASAAKKAKRMGQYEADEFRTFVDEIQTKKEEEEMKRLEAEMSRVTEGEEVTEVNGAVSAEANGAADAAEVANVTAEVNGAATTEVSNGAAEDSNEEVKIETKNDIADAADTPPSPPPVEEDETDGEPDFHGFLQDVAVEDKSSIIPNLPCSPVLPCGSTFDMEYLPATPEPDEVEEEGESTSTSMMLLVEFGDEFAKELESVSDEESASSSSSSKQQFAMPPSPVSFEESEGE